MMRRMTGLLLTLLLSLTSMSALAQSTPVVLVDFTVSSVTTSDGAAVPTGTTVCLTAEGGEPVCQEWTGAPITLAVVPGKSLSWSAIPLEGSGYQAVKGVAVETESTSLPVVLAAVAVATETEVASVPTETGVAGTPAETATVTESPAATSGEGRRSMAVAAVGTLTFTIDPGTANVDNGVSVCITVDGAASQICQ